MATRASGFTLIELIVALAGLGILSSLAIPNYLKYLDYAKVDQAKSMLNSAAADCLQELRNYGTTRLDEPVDRSLLSIDLLESIEYDFKSNLNTCGSVLISTTSSNADKRLPTLGFSISEEGKVTKQSVDEGGDTTAPAKSWAGVNMIEGEGLEEFLEYKASIAAAQATCQKDLDDWLRSTGDGKSYEWNSSATSDCPSNPPKVVSSKCTTNGCNAPLYAMDGVRVGSTPESYQAALDKKFGIRCREWSTEKKNSLYTNVNNSPETFKPDCGDQEFWFFNGDNVGSQVTWEKLNYKVNNPTGIQTLSDGSELYLCLGEEKATEALMTKCIDDNEEAGCQNQINEKVAANYNGQFVARSGGPGACSSVNWMCDGKNYQTDKTTYEIDCNTPQENCDSKVAPRYLSTCKKAHTYWRCTEWATCMGFK